jgi:hypothetical protein
MSTPGFITKPGEMTIINSFNKLQFYTDVIGIDKTLQPGKVYNFNVDHQFGEMWLSPGTALKLPAKLYDFEQPFRDQVLTTLRHEDSNMNIGVLLEGYKGQGKSVIAKQLAIESGLPIVIITGNIPKICDYQNYLNKIRQDYVLFIDEFEKFFPESDHPESKIHVQDSFLTFLDGTLGLEHKRLVIFTSNKEIGDKFINRPSRIRYYKKFNFMSKNVFNAIIEDKLKNKDFRQDLEDNLDVPSCTVDIVTTIIEEINIQNKPYSEFKDFFNHKERETIYTKYRKEPDGSWKWIEELRSKREIGVENEYAQNLIGYNAKILNNDGETIIYEMNDYVDPDNEDDKKADEMKRYTFKLIKQKWEKYSLVV